VTVYGVPGTSRVELETDDEGKFVVDRAVPLDYNNTPITYRVDAQPPADAPAGTTGDSKSFSVPSCGAEASVVLHLKTPVPNHGAVEGKVTDQETGAPVPDVHVRACAISCQLGKTDVNGDYRVEDIHVGDDGATSRTVTVTSEPDGYWKREASVLVRKDQTSKLDLKLLKRRTGAGTGPCQGKLCVGEISETLRAGGLTTDLPTVRSPARPVSVAALAGMADA
jgi:hypothetical protein